MSVRAGNTYYIDATGEEVTSTVRVVGVLFTPEAATAVLVLKDRTPANNIKLEFKSFSGNETTQLYSFKELPVVFQSGIKVTTVTDCTATLILSEGGGE
jgi:hypothetical protein